jgi:hypothetical protein
MYIYIYGEKERERASERERECVCDSRGGGIQREAYSQRREEAHGGDGSKRRDMRDALQYAQETVEECSARLRALRVEQAHAATELKATQAEVHAHTHKNTHTHTHAATELCGHAGRSLVCNL